DLLVENRRVPGDRHVVRSREGEPDPVIADARPDSAARGRMPPVLDVAFAKLSRRRPAELLARDVPGRHGQRHDVLELVAKAIRAARLIEAGTAPHPAGASLIEQQAIRHEAEGSI